MICIEIYQKESRYDKKNAIRRKFRYFSAVSGWKRDEPFVPTVVYFPPKPFYKWIL